MGDQTDSRIQRAKHQADLFLWEIGTPQLDLNDGFRLTDTVELGGRAFGEGSRRWLKPIRG